MGLIIPQTVRIRTNSMTCKHYREKGYIFKKCGDFVEVDVMDLYPGSHEKVKIICDICGNESEIEYRHFIENRKKGVLVTCGSNSCKNKKYEDTCMKKHGVKNAFQSEEIKEKIKNTNLERHGAENPFGSKEIQDKIKGTWQKNYGENITNPGQAQDVKDKIKATLKEKHGEGITCSFQLESVKEKSKQTWQKNYGEGIINPGQAQVVKDKIKDTWKNNYGEDITCPFQVESVKEKSKQTMLNNYGVEYAMQNKEIQNKSKITCLLHWGVNNPFQSEEVKEKIKNTNLERHGVEHAMQNEEIKNKAFDSFQFHGTGPCSRAQKYIQILTNGTLNKHICGSLVDVYIEKENIVIEHDGAGHFLTDIFNGNKTPTKESLLYEKEREDKIINNGYRMIRFIATKDRIPSDEVILNLIEGFKNSDFKVIRINFEEGTIDRDYNEKWYCNFGKLRRITKEDLEQFENNNDRLEN